MLAGRLVSFEEGTGDSFTYVVITEPLHESQPCELQRGVVRCRLRGDGDSDPTVEYDTSGYLEFRLWDNKTPLTHKDLNAEEIASISSVSTLDTIGPPSLIDVEPEHPLDASLLDTSMSGLHVILEETAQEEL